MWDSFSIDRFVSGLKLVWEKLAELAGKVDKNKFVGEAGLTGARMKHILANDVPADLLLKGNEIYEGLKAGAMNIKK